MKSHGARAAAVLLFLAACYLLGDVIVSFLRVPHQPARHLPLQPRS